MTFSQATDHMPGFRLQSGARFPTNQTRTQSKVESDGMVRIDKLYFTLKEVAERWQVKMDDLAYLAENGDLRVSVRLYNVHLEEGIYELDTRDGHPSPDPVRSVVVQRPAGSDSLRRPQGVPLRRGTGY
jgi:hypothetical protein